MDKDLLAKRLAFIWHNRENNLEKFTLEKMGAEKERIYSAYGEDQEVFEKSQKYFYETHGPDYNKILSDGGKCYFDEGWNLKKAGD